jgi:hypothetical protein
MKVTLEPFVAEHGVEILGKAAEGILDWLLKAECGGPAYTGRLEDGRILGCAGLTIELPEVASGWLIPTELVKQYPLAFHKVVTAAFERILFEYPGIRCIQGTADSDKPERSAWLRRMGFKWVGHMTLLWPDKKDVELFTMLRGNGNGH